MPFALLLSAVIFGLNAYDVFILCGTILQDARYKRKEGLADLAKAVGGA